MANPPAPKPCIDRMIDENPAHVTIPEFCTSPPEVYPPSEGGQVGGFHMQDSGNKFHSIRPKPMNREKIWIVGIIVAVSAAVICAASALFSYRVYVSSRKLVTEYRNDLFDLRQSYAELGKQFATITDDQKLFQNKSAENNFNPNPLKEKALASRNEDESASDQRKKVQQLAQIISSTGLDQLAASEDLDPTILAKIYEEYALQDQVSNYREQTLARNHEQHQLDRNQYHEELTALYDRARLRRRGEGNAKDQEKAFSEMLTKYPDAYATGMAIAERALRSAFRQKSNDVEKYYGMLRENDMFSTIVTDRGMEAMPNLENYLAYSYIREGRVEEAQVFIEALESKYADSFVLTRGADRRFKWLPASQAAENLRMLIE
jgi:hypothetical protein